MDRAAADGRELPRRRLETAHLRQAPDFMVIGTQRGGTTSLFRYLTEHPEIGASKRKEVHYFDRYYDRGRDWYLAHFPKRGKFPVVGEATPYYLYHPEVPDRVAKAVPEAKFVALLRDPVDRAYSHYQLMVRRGVEKLSFAEAVEREPERLATASDPAQLAWRQSSYVSRGEYASQLERWFARFPRERFLVLGSEEFYAAPAEAVREVQAFVGLAGFVPETLKAYHLSEYADMDPATRERLRAHYAPHNRRLAELLGRDFGWERA